MNRDPEKVEIHYLEKLADLKDAHILEVGCGDGRLTWRYSAQAKCVTGVDPDPVRLADATAVHPPSLKDTVTFVQAFSETLPFASETFDGAILAWSL